MKTGILTFHASHNYGSMLQAYALQHTLESLGYRNIIINFRSRIQKSLIPPPVQLSHPRSSLSRLLKTPGQTIALYRKYLRFENFLKKHLMLSKELQDYEEVKEYIQKNNYDAIVVGSDQIWNPGCWDFDKSYLLDFPLAIRRIAYAPSLGASPESIPNEKKEILANALVKFDALSTREQRGSDLICKLTGKETAVVLDPTLLLDRNAYISLYNERPIVNGQYIFYYTPREEPGLFQSAQLIAKMLRMKIVVTQSFPDYVGDNVIPVYDCGPCEFLNIMAHSSYNVGKSFHLMAFSLIFQKEFLLVSDDLDSRMTNILGPLHLLDRIVKPNQSQIYIPKPIGDYQQMHNRLIDLRESSLLYLQHAMEL